MKILKTVELTKIYGTGETAVHALDGVSFEVERGEFVSIVGTSGSGKSTMLHMIGGLDRPSSGDVIVDGRVLGDMDSDALTIFRRRNIGFVFQQYNLIPMLNVWENVILPIKLDGKKPQKEYVEMVIDTLGLSGKMSNLPNTLSGGQQQRAAIARALATKPGLLLCDEPTGNLDSQTSQDVLGLLKVTSEQFHQTIIMITHNEEIAQLADRILRIEDGSRGKRSAGKVRERGINASWWGMALGNFGRSWKRGMIVMLSIALSLVTLNGIFMMVRGYSLDAYQSVLMALDFEMDKLPGYAPYAVMNGITAEIQAQLNACPYAGCVGYVRYSEEYHEMEPHLYQVWDRIVQERLSGEWLKKWEQMKAENQMKITLMGIDRAVFEKLEWCGKTCTWEEFSRGNAVIVDKPLLSGQGVSSYQAGDDFVMSYQSGTEKAYHVLGEARLPYSLDYPYANLITVTVLIPDREFIACTGSDAAMRAFIDAIPGEEEKVQQYLEQTVLQEDGALLLHSVLDLEESFARYLYKYYFVGGALAVVLALIGIMNFYNMSAASVLSRRRELALLEVVGMTKRQICKMLMAEGCLYLCGAFLLAVIVTVLFGGRILTAALGQAFFFTVKVTVLPCVVLLPLLAVIAVLISVSQFRRMIRESVIERL